MKYMAERVDWSRRGHYIRSRHQIEPGWATEAVNDPDAYWVDPDPASTSGAAVRIIGYSTTADMTVTVIVLRADTDPSDRPDGDWWGANAWPANTRDTRIYREQT